jgi:hypothetical protein
MRYYGPASAHVQSRRRSGAGRALSSESSARRYGAGKAGTADGGVADLRSLDPPSDPQRAFSLRRNDK